MSAKPNSFVYALAIALAIMAVYATGLNNQLVFDDARLTDGTIFGSYGLLFPLKPRFLSYSSFVWLQAILGEGWWKQRAFNVVLHVGTAIALYGLALDLLRQTQWGATQRVQVRFEASLRHAAGLGVAMWACNPVAVYAVAYLVQRSILMATFFSVLACWGFLRGLGTGSGKWFALALLCYVCAVASKEHAVTVALLSVPLYTFVQRPDAKRLVRMVALAMVALGAMGGLLWLRYGSIMGTVFDETSRAFAVQLEQLHPGISAQIYPLSLVNQASLFFQYGLFWVLPYVGWMSIDLRPPFPLGFLGWHGFAALIWLGCTALALRTLFKRSDIWGLLALIWLIPALLFLTEFATVWLQDPFVLYRSYLWSMSLALLFALPFVFLCGARAYVLGGLLVVLLAALSFERIQSLQSPSRAWADASTKIDRQAPPNAVGRWRPLLNQATEAQERGLYDEALRLFAQAEELGEPLGSARFNMGVSLQQLRKHEQALDNFALAQVKGFDEAALYYQRGESLYALGRFPQALESFTQALQRPQAPAADEYTRMRLAESAVAMRDFDGAIRSYQQLLKIDPQRQRYQIGLSMAYVGKKDTASALNILDALIEKQPTAQAFYARALAFLEAGKRLESVRDVEFALKLEPNNPMYAGLLRNLNAKNASQGGKP